jgi:hypothetical protein
VRGQAERRREEAECRRRREEAVEVGCRWGERGEAALGTGEAASELDGTRGSERAVQHQ